jgi:hypothetical protein
VGGNGRSGPGGTWMRSEIAIIDCVPGLLADQGARDAARYSYGAPPPPLPSSCAIAGHADDSRCRPRGNLRRRQTAGISDRLDWALGRPPLGYLRKARCACNDEPPSRI